MRLAMSVFLSRLNSAYAHSNGGGKEEASRKRRIVHKGTDS
jgi:hypothetical protein